MSQIRKNNLIGTVLAGLVFMIVAGCAPLPRPFVPKTQTPPAIVYCNDYTGHIAGSKPWVMGGSCCCTPTDKLMTQLHRDGFCVGMTAEDLREEYEKAGIKLRGPGHNFCNGLCDHGPHVVLGGNCMCPPTPGTSYYEKVVIGKSAMKNELSASTPK